MVLLALFGRFARSCPRDLLFFQEATSGSGGPAHTFLILFCSQTIGWFNKKQKCCQVGLKHQNDFSEAFLGGFGQQK